jgi:hypothetical protein
MHHPLVCCFCPLHGRPGFLDTFSRRPFTSSTDPYSFPSLTTPVSFDEHIPHFVSLFSFAIFFSKFRDNTILHVFHR